MTGLSRLRRPDVNPVERRLLLLLGAASFFSQYDEQLFSLLLVQIQSDLQIPEASLGLLGSLVRLGALPAFAVMLCADRVGRRSVLLWTIVGYTTFTAATALAPGYWSFVGFQFLSRMFIAAEFMLAMVVITEEFRPGNRGWGIGVLSTLAVLGRGLAMILFAFVEEVPFGWRGLYLVGIAPLLLVVWFRRRLPETQRYEDVARTLAPDGFWRGSLRPLAGLVRAYPRRFVAVAVVGFLWSFSNGPVDFFLPKYMQQVHGWRPSEFAQLAIFGGGLGITGLLFAGWFSDRWGRRPTLVTFMVLEPLGAIVLYSIGGLTLLPVYIGWVFASVSNDVVGRTVGNELFPTSHRSTAAGGRALIATLGSVLGLACESLLFAVFDTHWSPVRALALAGLLMPLIVWLTFPETSNRSLEEIAPDKSHLPASG